MQITNQARWDQFVAASQRGPGRHVLAYTQQWVDLMEARIAAGARVADIAEETSHQTPESNGITGAGHTHAVAILAETWAHGEELRQWHNAIEGAAQLNAGPGGVVSTAHMRVGGELG